MLILMVVVNITSMSMIKTKFSRNRNIKSNSKIEITRNNMSNCKRTSTSRYNSTMKCIIKSERMGNRKSNHSSNHKINRMCNLMSNTKCES